MRSFPHVDDRVRVHRLHSEKMTPGCTMGGGQASRETLGPGIHP